MNIRPWMITLIALSLCCTAFAQPTTIQEGKPLPVISATAATGRWLERAALDPASYGKVRGVSPATSAEPKIVLYTSALSEEFFTIAAAVDTYIADRPELVWSFVQVTDTRGAQFGGYTADELRARLDTIQVLVKKHGIKHLSFLVAAPGSGTTDPDKTVVLAHVRPSDKSRKPIIDWVTAMPAETLQGTTLSDQLTSMDAVINPKK